MRTRLINYLALVLLSVWSVDTSYAQVIFCENFNNGIGNWTQLSATITVPSNNGNSVLDVNDNSGESWLINTCYDHHTVGPSISYDFELLNDAVPGSPGTTNQIMLITDTNFPWTQLRATFVLNNPITENSGVINVTVPINTIGQNAPLPSNALGSWQMSDPTQWNTLVNSFVGVAFFVDVLGSTFSDENFQIDNFCYVPLAPVNTNLNISTTCNSGAEYIVEASSANQPGYIYSWQLFQTTIPGQTSGGTQIGATQTGGFSTFTGLNVQNFYYLRTEIADACLNTIIFTDVVPYHEIESIFNTEDEFGNARTTFCYGEDVYLDGVASFGETNYHIDIERRPFPNNGQSWGNYSSLGWGGGTAPLLNLSDAFVNNNYDFEPGWEYRLKLAVQNVPECVNWVETVHTFVVECCDGFFDAKFSLNRKATSGGFYELEAVQYDLYPTPFIQHTWTVYSSPNLDGGPYTLVTVIIDDVFTYEVPEGLCYFVVHSLETLCEELCYGQSDCINAGKSEKEELCDLCGPIDCSLLTDICLAPDTIYHECIGRNPIIERLKWDLVLDALGYEVQIIWNDINCCETLLQKITLNYETTTNYLDIDNIQQPAAWDCLRWRVRTRCEVGESPWSEYQCFTGCKRGRSLEESSIHSNTARLFPNPTNDRVQVVFNDEFTGSLELIDKIGRVILIQEVINVFRSELDLSALPAGIYWIVTKNDVKTQAYKLVKQ